MRLLPLVLVLLIAGCGVIEQSLENRAVDYYNTLIGRRPHKAFSSFNTPAYRQLLKTAGTLKDYDAALKAKKSSDRYPEIAGESIYITQQDEFAYTVADPALGPVLAGLEPVRWVKAGRRWCVYLGSDKEVNAYGLFPATLAPPDVEAIKAAAAGTAAGGDGEGEGGEAGTEADGPGDTGADGGGDGADLGSGAGEG
ncbi:hypothetical protein JW859_13890 [bacterium]|nr:hypothetical protein [bacterium]